MAASNPEPQAQEPVLAPFRVGDVIGGKYEIIELIGAGAMGYVVAARHVELGEKVALKFLRAESLANAEVVARFAREARAAVAIKSEHVARVFDIGALPDGAPFIVMEFLEGRNLSEVLRDQGPLPVKVAVEYVMQVCEALAAAHANGIVHRDIKPENLFLTEQAQGIPMVKVLDFGISKVALTGTAIDTKVPLIQTMLPVGSPVFMSPEQIRSANDVDARTDIWSLGCVLYELLAGTAAFDAPSLTQLTANILEKNPPSLRVLRSDVPEELEAIIGRCLEKHVGQRFQNVGELAIALYPFAPRRARISAERCTYLLHGAAVPSIDFELSQPPPPAPESTSAISVAARRSAAGSIKTSTQASVSWTELPSFRPNHGWSRALLLGAAIAIAGGGYAIARHRQPGAAAASGSDAEAAGGAAALPAPTTGTPPAGTLPHAEEDPEPQAAPTQGGRSDSPSGEPAGEARGEANAAARPKSAASAAPARAHSPPPARTASPAPPNPAKSDPDPGF